MHCDNATEHMQHITRCNMTVWIKEHRVVECRIAQFVFRTLHLAQQQLLRSADPVTQIRMGYYNCNFTCICMRSSSTPAGKQQHCSRDSRPLHARLRILHCR
jgi:hypothetical protein